MVARMGLWRALALASWAAIVLATAYLFIVGVEVTHVTKEADGSPSVRTTYREPAPPFVISYPALATLAIVSPARAAWLRVGASALLVVWSTLTIFSYGQIFGPLAVTLFIATGVPLLSEGKRSPPAPRKD